MCYHAEFIRFSSNGKSVITEIRLQNLASRVPPFKVIKVVGTDTDRSSTHDFLLKFYSNHWHISYRFRDKQQYQSKIANKFPPRVLTAPIGIFNGGEAQKLE